MPRRAAAPGIEPVGLALHIGSQLTDLAPYRAAFAKLAAMAIELRQSGLPVKHLDLGGGLGIAYESENPPSLADYAAVVEQTVGTLGLPLIFEPGRRLIGNAGILVTRVTYVKEGVNRTFIITDAAMNDLIRPMLYEAYHDIVPVRAGRTRGAEPARSISSARSAKAPISSPNNGRCRPWRPAICSPYFRQGPMVPSWPHPTICGRWRRKLW